MAIYNWDGNLVEGTVGTTVAMYYDTVRIMSDVWGTGLYGVYFNKELGKFQIVGADTYEYHSNGKAKVEIDGGEDILMAGVKALYKDHYDMIAYGYADQVASQIAKGDTVKVVSGRNGKGAVGKVVVVMEKPYGMGYRSVMMKKFGIALDDETIEVAAANGKVYKNYKNMVWVWARNVEKVFEVNEAEKHEYSKTNALARVRDYLRKIGKNTAEIAKIMTDLETKVLETV